MIKIIQTLIAATVFSALTSCYSAQQNAAAQQSEQPTMVSDKPVTIIGWNSEKAVPKARIYKTNGNFVDNVPITLGTDRKTIISFPSPADVENSQPIPLENGYYLDRRGITPETAFTTYTYRQYSSLKNTPTLKQLKHAVIPGAIVTEIVELPFPVGTPTKQQCDSLINENLPGCKTVYKIEAIMIGPGNI